jgi:potassium/hydrogen antiporter
MIEPRATAIALLVVGLVLAACVLSTRLAARTGVPVFLVFVLLGLVAGQDGLGGIAFDDYAMAFRVGYGALVLILFDAGLNTPVSTFRKYLAPSLVLATIGVVVTAGLVAIVAHASGFAWTEALLLGAIVSSTDAAAVFSVLKTGGVELRERVGATLEVESGLNDPMAVLLTTALTGALVAGHAPEWTAMGSVLVELVVGAIVGVALGWATRHGLTRLQLPVTALYPVLTLGVAFLIFGAATLVHGSGFLAVYVAGMMIGDARLPYRAALARIHDFTAWAGQVGMFVMLGLLASPARVMTVALPGLAIGLFVALVARPLAVLLCLVPFRYKRREIAYVGWVGLKGAVPIVLACIPILARAQGAEKIFDVVFFAVVVSAALQGSTVRLATKWLRAGKGVSTAHRAVLEITATRPVGAELLSYDVHAASAVCGVTLADIPFPESAAVMLVVRGDELLPARGPTELLPGDVVYVFCRSEDRPEIDLFFGRPHDA